MFKLKFMGPQKLARTFCGRTFFKIIIYFFLWVHKNFIRFFVRPHDVCKGFANTHFAVCSIVSHTILALDSDLMELALNFLENCASLLAIWSQVFFLRHHICWPVGRSCRFALCSCWPFGRRLRSWFACVCRPQGWKLYVLHCDATHAWSVHGGPVWHDRFFGGRFTPKQWVWIALLVCRFDWIWALFSK